MVDFRRQEWCSTCPLGLTVLHEHLDSLVEFLVRCRDIGPRSSMELANGSFDFSVDV